MTTTAVPTRRRPPAWLERVVGRSRRLGLRARITLAFALGGLLLSIIVGGITWALARESQLNQRIETAEERVLQNAVQVQRNLTTDRTAVEGLLVGLPRPQGAVPILLVDDQAFTPNPLEIGDPLDSIPEELRGAVTTGVASRMISRTAENDVILTVGIPLTAAPDVAGLAQYYERVSLDELQDDLRLLAISLTGAGIVTTLAGAAVGAWASRRTLRPLADVSDAARAIADGDLATRLHGSADNDLEVLVRSFNQMAEALQERVERDARFASEVSHELRSPVMTLTASLEVLENSRDEMPDRAQTALTLLSADIERFTQLVEDLLEISRFDAGAASLTLEPVLLPEIVAATSAATGHHVAVVTEPELETMPLRVDKRRIGQILANLLGNAAKYAGGPRRLVLDCDDSYAYIAVEDDGPGVPDDEKLRIFDRFSRGIEGGNRGADTGVGLGLALVSEHVRLHQGEAWVEDKPDGSPGARFVVALPLRRADDDDLVDDDGEMA